MSPLGRMSVALDENLSAGAMGYSCREYEQVGHVGMPCIATVIECLHACARMYLCVRVCNLMTCF